jgi:Cof subfamily protein (haloacid dehalogenase superfamily)
VKQQRYFVTDLDGTLLSSDARLSVFTADTVAELLNRGAVVSFATARSYRSSQQVVSAISWKYPVVLYNGAVIWDPAAGKVAGGNWLDRETTNGIIEMGRSERLLPLLFALDGGDNEHVLHEKLVRACDLSFYRSRPGDPRFCEVARLACPDSYRTLIVTYIGTYEQLAPLREKVLDRFGDVVHTHFMKDVYIENHYFLEFSHPLANKKEGLKQWTDLVGCDPSEVTVFGDNLNDVGMFETAGWRVAVSNAHPDIRAMADHITASNNDDGVARYLRSKMISPPR